MQFDSTTRPHIGEIKRHNQRRSMCVLVEASFGGGHGDIWMTEGLVYEFRDGQTFHLVRAVCMHVDPAQRHVQMLVYEGDTWGRYATGSTVTVPCAQLQHVYEVGHHGPALVSKSKQEALKAQAMAALSDITLMELRTAVATEHENYLSELLGGEAFLQIRNLVASFSRLSQAVGSPGVNGYRAPNPAVFQHKQKLLSQLKRIKQGARND